MLRLNGHVPEVVFIDTGLTNTLNSTDCENCLDLFRAIAEFNGCRSGKLVERCPTPCLDTDKETFTLKMQDLLAWPYQDFGHPIGYIEGRQVAPCQDGGQLCQRGHPDVAVGEHQTTEPQFGPFRECLTNPEAARQTDDV